MIFERIWNCLKGIINKISEFIDDYLDKDIQMGGMNPLSKHRVSGGRFGGLKGAEGGFSGIKRK